MNIINGVPMYYFIHEEFYRRAVKDGPIIDWANRIDQRLLILLDSLRHQWARPITISPAAGTIGRLTGTSLHSIARDGVCRAVDVYPGVRGRVGTNGFYQMCRRVGFTGIGIYPVWQQGVGFHLDTRTDREPGNPATWGHVEGKYCAIETALAVLD